MECRDIREKLSAYLEGSASSEEKKLIEGHLSACPECRGTLEDLKKAGNLIRELPEVEPPPWLTKKIMVRVRAEEERKKGLWRKLFYPLHIKVPLEALATVLIAVVAVYVFKAVEPEMRQARLTAPSSPVVTREEAPRLPGKPGADSLTFRKKPAALPPAGGTGEQKQYREQSSSSGSLEEPPAARGKGAKADKVEEGMQAAGAPPRPKPREAEGTTPAPAARDKHERKKLAAAPMAKEAPVKKAQSLEVSVRVKDMRAGVGKIEGFLGQVGARKIEKESLEGKEVLTAEIRGQNMEELMKKLKAIGEVKEKAMPPNIIEEDTVIRIEVVPAP
jgi:hypothetical protein